MAHMPLRRNNMQTKTFAFTPDFKERLINEIQPGYQSLISPVRLYFKGQAGLNIHFIADIQENEQAALIIMPGWAETGIRYAELIHNLKPYNLSTYIMDHRGMGFSERIPNSDPQRTHIDSFQNYISDMKQFIDTIVCAKPHNNIYLLAHSFGGLVSSHYLAQEPHKISAAVLSSPLLEISNGLLKEPIIHTLALAKERIGQGSKYALGQTAPKAIEQFTDANTHSYDRWALWQSILQENPEISLGGMTWHWLAAAITAAQYARDIGNKIVTPTLLFQAGQDTMAPAHGQNVFCKNAGIEKRVFPNAKHELLQETDDIRNFAISEALSFLGIR